MTDKLARAAVAAVLAPMAWGQYAPAPTQYSVTQVNSLMGPPVTQQIYRDGDMVVLDHPGHHTRGLYNLKTHTNIGWDSQDPGNGCSNGTFAGDWGDPFVISDIEDLLKNSKIPPTKDTVNGVATMVFEAVDSQSKIKLKVWREPKYGMVMRADMTPPGGATTTIIETKQFSFSKPPASIFTAPASCTNPAPPVSPFAQRWAADTGDDAANFADANMPPGSSNSCTMLMRFLKAESMQPLTNFQVALDLAFDPSHPPGYHMGGSPSGRTVFSGGQLKEYTAQIRNGVLSIPNVPAVFDVEITFAGGNGGASSAMVYRKCSGPQTVLLYVIHTDFSKPVDWIWAKSGKFAAH